MNNWQQLKLGNVADVILSNVDKKSNENERSIRLCNYTDVYKNSFINIEKSKSFMIASCNENEYEKFILKKGQVAITKDSETPDDIGVSAYITDDFEDVILGYHLSLIKPNLEKLDGSYLHYWFSTKQSKRYFENNAGGSGQRCTLTLDCIKSVPLHLPNIQTQQRIAAVLSSLDAKIELNNRINAELEAMAKTLYDYWFVQFDFPDKNGKPYKSSGGKMAWNEQLKREIPEGWEVKRLSEITDVATEQINPYEYPDKDFKHYSIPAFDASGTYTIEKGKEIQSNKFSITKSDVLVSKLNPWFNRVVYARDESDTISSTEFVVWRSSDESLKNYLYMIARDQPFISYCSLSATGTSNSHKRVNPDVMMKYNVPYNNDLSVLFGKSIAPTIKKLSALIIENNELKNMRDWLLPMLMNGQVKVL